MLVFYFFAAIVIWLGILSLVSGLRFSSYVRRELAHWLPHYTPFVSIIAPCRGLENGLKENITALFEQNYPAYEILFVTDRSDDPSLGTIEEMRELWSDVLHRVTQCLIAGPAIESGQKVHNLRVAVEHIDKRSEFLVFVDTDGRPCSDWLRSLIAPLRDRNIGATTGYRWFLPKRGGLATQLRSVWNASIASALGGREDKNFCWGGSTAIRKSTFEKLQVEKHWQGTVSDDFTLTRVLQDAGMPIKFVPACLVASIGDCSAKELWEFTNRQLKITRVYAPHLWKPLLIGSLLFSVVFFGGLALLIMRLVLGLPYLVLVAALLVIYLLGTAKAFVRLQAVAMAMAEHKNQLWTSLPAHLLLWPFASVLFSCNAIAAAFSRRLTWRGITYELKSANEAVIISRESN